MHELQPGESITITVTVAASPIVEPEPPEPPEPEPGDWDRIIPAGAHGDFTFDQDGERVLFEEGAVVRGVVWLRGRDLVISGLHTTSEDSHETAVQIGEGSSGELRDFLIEHIGSPGNGMGYSSISANDDDDPVGEWAGPWTIEDGYVDCRDNGHYGFEIWGVQGLTVRNVMFTGKGGRTNPDTGAHAENGFMSTPRCHDMTVDGCTFDMSQGCYRVQEVVEQNGLTWTNNTVLGFWGDCLAMNGGKSDQCDGHVVKDNRVQGAGSGNRIFAYLAGRDHVITDNRLTDVANPRQGEADNVTWERNGPNDGPGWDA